jgi:Peptidase A4 family
MKRFAVSVLVSVLCLLWISGNAVAQARPADHIVHGFARRVGKLRRLKHGTSTNWSGYAIASSLTAPESGVVSSVGGQWTVPTLQCAGLANEYSAAWLGIDGYSDSTVEQIGTEQDCQYRRPVYYAWVELYPQASSVIRLRINPGDSMQASVAHDNRDSFTLTLIDRSTGRGFATIRRLRGAQLESAEWVAEAPSSLDGVLPLANFGTISFSDATAELNGHTGTISDPNWKHDEIVMKQAATGPVKAQPSALHAVNGADSFGVTWQHS